MRIHLTPASLKIQRYASRTVVTGDEAMFWATAVNSAVRVELSPSLPALRQGREYLLVEKTTNRAIGTLRLPEGTPVDCWTPLRGTPVEVFIHGCSLSIRHKDDRVSRMGAG